VIERINHSHQSTRKLSETDRILFFMMQLIGFVPTNLGNEIQICKKLLFLKIY